MHTLTYSHISICLYNKQFCIQHQQYDFHSNPTGNRFTFKYSLQLAIPKFITWENV
uniref:Uncharacterized protein n=1 Tax=Octopus bimaculoides TaxID=37653 RepID=A0A0L8GRB8_OCTBM